MNKYQVEKKIGKGSYGNVYICRAKADGKRYVLKKIPLDNMSSKEKHSTRQEVALLQSLQHPNIVGYKDSFMTNNDKELCIVMTYCEGGDLSSKIKEYEYKKIPEKLVMKWFAQLLLAVEFLHSRKVLHRDLKSQNIFLMKDGTVKLGDFGIARVFERTLDMAKTSIGTPLYMSPEVCNNRPYNYKSDIWSLGCILYELCARKPPFNARDLRGLFVKIIRGVYSPIPYTYSTKLQDLVRKTLYTNPHRRPSISQILKSAYVRKSAESYIHELLVNSNALDNGSTDPNRLRHTMVMERRETSNIKIQAAELGYDLDAIMRGTSSVDSSQDSKSSHRKGSDTESEQHSVQSSRHQHARRPSHHSNAPSSVAPPPTKPVPPKEDVVLNKRKIPLRDVKRAVAKLNKMEEEQQRVKEALEKLKQEKLDRQSRLARANEIRRNALSQKKRKEDDAILEKQRRKQKAAEERRRRIKQGLAAPPKYGSKAQKGDPSSDRSRSSEKTPPKSHAPPAVQPAQPADPDQVKRFNRIRESKQELDQYVEKRKQMEKQIQNIEQELHEMASKGVGVRHRPSVAAPSDDYREHIKRMAQPDHIPSSSKAPSSQKDELSGLSHRDRILKMKEMKRRAEEAEKQNMLQQARLEYHSNRVMAQRMQYNQYHGGSSPPRRRPSEQPAHDDKSSLQNLLPQQDRYQQNEQFLQKQDKRRPSRSVSPDSDRHHKDDDSEENELIEEMEKAYTTQKKQLSELRKTITQAYGKSIHDLRALAESKDDEPDSEEDDLESDDESEDSDDEQYEEMHELVQPGRLSDRISHLRQLCIKYLGESNFKKLYRAMRDGTLPNDDRAREQQITALVGAQKLEYVSLIDELLFTEDSLA